MENIDEFVAKVMETPTSCFYRVSESIVKIDKDPNEVKSFFWDEDFKGPDLLLSRSKAIAHYGNRLLQFSLDGINKEFFGCTFASPDQFIPGANYAYSLVLKIVGCNSDGECNEFDLLGGDEDDIEKIQAEEKKYLEAIEIPDVQINQIGGDLVYEKALVENVIRYSKLTNFSTPDNKFNRLSLKDKIIKVAEDLSPLKEISN